MHPETRYKFCKFCENCARDTTLRGVYIPHFDQNLCKNFSFGVLYPYCCTDGTEIWHGGGGLGGGEVPSFVLNFTPPPSVQRVAPAGQKPQNRPLSNLNTGEVRCAQRCR